MSTKLLSPEQKGNICFFVLSFSERRNSITSHVFLAPGSPFGEYAFCNFLYAKHEYLQYIKMYVSTTWNILFSTYFCFLPGISFVHMVIVLALLAHPLRTAPQWGLPSRCCGLFSIYKKLCLFLPSRRASML